nr:TNF receptor-associated factor family protein DDB_G0272348-like [Pocillopora verrucosa]
MSHRFYCCLQLEVHIRYQCPEAAVTCEYESLGCKAMFPRSNTDSHSKSEVEGHLRLALHCLEATRLQVHDLVSLVKEKSQQIERLMSSDQEKTQQMERLMAEVKEQSLDVKRLMSKDQEHSQHVQWLMSKDQENSQHVQWLMSKDQKKIYSMYNG